MRLRMAKVNKERAQQMVESTVKSERDRLQEQRIAEHMENERLEHLELEHKLGIEKAKQRERVKHINQQQIAMKEAQRDEALAEYLKEKDQVQELVEKIAAEDAEEHAVRMHKQQETRQILGKFMLEQKAKQEAMEQAELEENERIEAYAREKREQARRLQEEKDRAEREKLKILNAMIGKMEAKNKEAQELELLRNDLHLEELEAEARRREEIQVRKELEDREEMKSAVLTGHTYINITGRTDEWERILDLGAKVNGKTLNENFRDFDNGSSRHTSMPEDISNVCESVEETPRLTGRCHSSADDETTIQ